MAFCPSCKGEIDANATTCPHCGRELPPPIPAPPAAAKKAWAYGRFSQAMLVAGQVVAIIALVTSVVGLVQYVRSGNWFFVFFHCPMLALMSLAAFFALARVAGLKR